MSLTEAPQASLVTPREPVLINGRRVGMGATYWITNAAHARKAGAPVMLARSGKSSGYAIAFTHDDAEKFFRLV